MHKDIEERIEKDLAEKQMVMGVRAKWYLQPDKPTRQLDLTPEQRKWLARHLRYQREAGKNPLEIRRNAGKISPESEALAKWEHDYFGEPRKPLRHMGLTQRQRDYLARYLRWSRNNPGPTPDEIKERHHQSWLTGRPDPSLPEWVTID